MNDVYRDIYNLLSASNSLHLGDQHQGLLIRYDQPRQQVKALVDQAVLLHTEMHTLLEQGAKTKNMFGQRSFENEQLINNCVDTLNRIYDQMVQLFERMENTAREERQKESLDNYRRSGEAARNEEISRQCQRETQSGYEAWCEAGNDPDKYW